MTHRLREAMPKSSKERQWIRDLINPSHRIRRIVKEVENRSPPNPQKLFDEARAYRRYCDTTEASDAWRKWMINIAYKKIGMLRKKYRKVVLDILALAWIVDKTDTTTPIHWSECPLCNYDTIDRRNHYPIPGISYKEECPLATFTDSVYDGGGKLIPSNKYRNEIVHFLKNRIREELLSLSLPPLRYS